MKKIAIFGLFLAMSGTVVLADSDACKTQQGNQSAQSSDSLDGKQLATGNDADHSSDPTIMNGSDVKAGDHA